MKTSSNIFIYTLLLCCFTVGSLTTVYAQAQSHSVFFKSYDKWANNDDPRSYESVKQRYAVEIRQGEWETIFAGLRDEFEQTKTDWTSNVEIYANFNAQFDSLVIEFLDIYKIANANYNAHLESITTARFHESVPTDYIIYFANREHEIIMCAREDTDGPCIDRPSLTVEQAQDLRYRGYTLDKLLEDFRKEPLEIIVQRIEESHQRWVNYLDKGYTMYPWESVINAKVFSWSVKSPPKGQLIIMHPGAGVQVPWSLVNDFSVNDVRVSQSILIEVLGILRYRGDFGEYYWGISSTVAMQDNLGPGVGFNIHLHRSISLGLNWHLSDEENRTFQKDPQFTASFNVLGWITSNRKYIERVF